MPKRHRKLPEILSPDQVALLIASASNLLHQLRLPPQLRQTVKTQAAVR
jgi:site-specific recombinase XerD